MYFKTLEKEAHRLASVMYQNAPNGGAPGAAPGEPPPQGAAPGEKKKDVIDAEFEETSN